jgi:acetyl esterase/lipase
MGVAFLVLSVIGAVFTLNALAPRSRRSVFAVPSFFAAWPWTELAPQLLVVELVLAGVFAWAGALESTAGKVALGVSVLSWAGMAVLVRRASGSGPHVQRALADGLGADYVATLGNAVDDATASRALSVTRLALALPIAGREVEVERDIRYADGAGRRHLLDVYRPAERVARAPVLVQVHGGAWIVGDKREQARPLMHHLARHGWVCVAPNYRRSPDATFPDHLVDVKRALGWVREHAADYGGDPALVAITGGSAGGHLAALAALTPNEPEYQPGFEDIDTSVSACVVFYGAYDLTGRFGGVGADGMGGLIERAVLKRRVVDDPAAFSRASPLDRVREDAPPFMVVHGTDDSLVPVEEARAFAARLREVSSAPTVYLELPHAQHAFEVFDTVRSETVVRGVHRFLASVCRAAGADDTARRPDIGLHRSG